MSLDLERELIKRNISVRSILDDYINGVSYLVGKPFIPLSSLSEKLCGLCWRSVKMLICSVPLKNPLLFSYAARFARSVLMCGCILQMSENRC